MPVIAVQGRSGSSARVASVTLLAASPATSIARTRANRSISSLSRSLRLRPRTKPDCVFESVSKMAQPNSIIPIHTPPLPPGAPRLGSSGSSLRPFVHRHVVRRARPTAPAQYQQGPAGWVSPQVRIRSANPHRCPVEPYLSVLIRTGIDSGWDAADTGPPMLRGRIRSVVPWAFPAPAFSATALDNIAEMV